MAIKTTSLGTKSSPGVAIKTRASVGWKEGGIVVGTPDPPPAPPPDPPEEPPVDEPPPIPPPAYDPDAKFNQTIAQRGLSNDANSAAIVSALQTAVNTVRMRAICRDNTPALYVVDSSMPNYTIQGVSSGGGTSGNITFRCPPNAVVGEGVDHPLILLSPAPVPYFSNRPYVEVRLYEATINHSTRVITCTFGGVFHYNSDGAILNPNATESLSIPFRGNGTGSGLSYMAGMITAEDFLSGEIRHAIRVSYSACHFQNGTFVSPATTSDQPHGSVSCSGVTVASNAKAKMGATYYLDSSVNTQTRTIPTLSATDPRVRLLRMTAKAMQDYGMILMDGTTANGLCIYMENDATAHWTTLLGPMYPLNDGSRSYGYLFRTQGSPGQDGWGTRGASDGIPWGSMHVLSMA